MYLTLTLNTMGNICFGTLCHLLLYCGNLTKRCWFLFSGTFAANCYVCFWLVCVSLWIMRTTYLSCVFSWTSILSNECAHVNAFLIAFLLLVVPFSSLLTWTFSTKHKMTHYKREVIVNHVWCCEALKMATGEQRKIKICHTFMHTIVSKIIGRNLQKKIVKIRTELKIWALFNEIQAKSSEFGLW